MTYKDLKIEDKCLVHRYIYYVLNTNVVSDYAYDCMEKIAREKADEKHPIHLVGSSNPDSYSDVVKQIAVQLLKDAED
jgi:NAD-dependent DNA ligase